MSPKLQRDLLDFIKYLHPERVGGTEYLPDFPLGHTSPSPTAYRTISQGSNSPVSRPSSLQRIRRLKAVGYFKGTPLRGQSQSSYRFLSVRGTRIDPPRRPKRDRGQGSTGDNAEPSLTSQGSPALLSTPMVGCDLAWRRSAPTTPTPTPAPPSGFSTFDSVGSASALLG